MYQNNICHFLQDNYDELKNVMRLDTGILGKTLCTKKIEKK